jgi:hypothetical protein
MQLKLGEMAADDPRHPQVLHDDGVDAEFGKVAQRVHEPVKLAIQHECVHRDEDAAGGTKRAGVAEELVQLVEREVLGVGAGGPALQPEVHGIGAVLERGEARLEPAGGREKLDGMASGAVCA